MTYSNDAFTLLLQEIEELLGNIKMPCIEREYFREYDNSE